MSTTQNVEDNPRILPKISTALHWGWCINDFLNLRVIICQTKIDLIKKSFVTLFIKDKDGYSLY